MEWNKMVFIPCEFCLFAVSCQSFIACTWGVVHIYFTSMCWGGGQVVGSIVSGFLISRVSRVPVLAGLMVLHLWLLVWLFVHKPQPREFYAYYVMSTICGFIDSIRTVVLQCRNRHTPVLSPITFPR